MPIPGTRAPGLEDVEWIDSRPDMEDGTYLLSFWQSSCLDCFERLQQVEEAHRQHPGIEAVSVHVPELGLDMDAARKVAERMDAGHYMAHDSDGAAAGRYGSRNAPRLFLLQDGVVEWQKTSGNSLEGLAGKVEELTGEGIDITEERGRDDIYLGYAYGAVNDGINFRGEKELSLPRNIREGKAYLSGRWRRERNCLEALDGSMNIYQKASRAGIVASVDGMKDVEVTVDGEPVPHRWAGDDLRVEGGRSYVRVTGRRMYSLIDGPERRSEVGIEPEKGARLYKVGFR
ncbi:MAG: hypothetical protein ABEJ07_04430 [Candidatus Nanohaloarchaea archaeon]